VLIKGGKGLEIENNYQNNGITIGKAIGIFFGMLLIQFGIGIPFAITNLVLVHNNLATVALYISLVGEICSYLVLIKVFILNKGEKLNLIEKPDKIIYGSIVLALLGYRFLYNTTIALLLNPIQPPQWIVENFQVLEISPVLLIITVVIVAPIFEEIIFRGIFLKRLALTYSNTKAIIIYSLIFAIVHFNINQSVNVFFIGIIFGIIYVKTKSLTACIWAHFVNDLVAIVVAYSPYAYILEREQFNIFDFIIGVILIGVVIYLYKNHLNISQVQTQEEAQEPIQLSLQEEAQEQEQG